MSIYTDMKKVLLDNGWTKNTMVNEDNNYCLLGAYREVVLDVDGDYPSARRDLSELVDVTSERLSNNQRLSYVACIHIYNDRKDTTFEDVLSALDEAHNRKVSE